MSDEDDGFYAQAGPETLVMYVIYELPKDHPKHYVVRRWEIRRDTYRAEQPTQFFRLGHTLEEAREHVPKGLIMIARDPDDQKHIVESWI